MDMEMEMEMDNDDEDSPENVQRLEGINEQMDMDMSGNESRQVTQKS